MKGYTIFWRVDSVVADMLNMESEFFWAESDHDAIIHALLKMSEMNVKSGYCLARTGACNKVLRVIISCKK